METPAVQESVAGSQLSLQEYFLILHRRRWLFFATFVAVFATMAVRVMVATPIYRSTAKLLVETEKKRGQDVVYETTGITGSRKLQTQMEVIRSAAVVARALAKVKLEPASIPMISVEALRDTDLVAINCDAPDNQLAADFANALAEEYVALSLENSQKAASQGLDFVNEQIQRAEAELRDREIEFQTFQEQAGPAGTGAAVSAGASRVQSLRDSAQQLKASIAASEASIARLRAEAGGGRGRAATGEVAASNARVEGLRAELGNLETQRATAMVEYAPTSQRVKSIDLQIEKIRAQIAEEMGRYLSNPLGGGVLPQIVQAEVQLLADKERSAAADRLLKQAQAEYDALPGNERRAAELKRLRDVAEQQYMSLLQAQQQLKLAKESVAAGALIVEPAVPRSTRIAPNRSRSMAMALALGFFLALVSVVVAQSIDGRFIGAEDVERVLGAPVLVAVPLLPEGESPILHVPMGGSQHAETYRLLRTSLHPQIIKRPVSTVLVTSLGREDGKTTAATNLAIAYAEAKRRVLLVDADLRCGKVADVLGLPNEMGLVQCIADGVEVASVARQTAHPSLFALPSGPLPANPAELLSSDRMLELLRELQGAWDVIVLDSSPAHGLSDAHVLASTCDATVLVVDMTSSTRSQLGPLAETLRRQGAFIPGAVANKLGTRFADHGFGYGPDERTAGPAEAPDTAP